LKGINCKHCQLNCKTQGKTECSKYNAKADRPNQLLKLINEAIKAEDYPLVTKLQKELDRFNYGHKNK